MIVAGVIGGLIDIDFQLLEGRSIYCIDWYSVGISFGVGAGTYGLGEVAVPLIGRGLGWARNGFARGAATSGRGTSAGAGAVPASSAARGAIPQLPAPKMMNHHLFPRQFASFFKSKGIDVHNFTVALGETSHLRGVHGGGLGNMPGRWNSVWAQWIEKNPNATATEVYQQLGTMMDRFGLGHLPINPY
jgi:hypothetical protein